MRKKRVLVTGGAGFLGSHLCERLLKEGNDVICVDNFFSGSKDNVRHLIGNKYFELIRHDVTVPLFIECDEIYNLACPASPKFYQMDPIQTTKTSFLGALNMLGLAKRTNSKILQASTSEIYGNPDIHPQVEEYWGNVNPIGIRSCYDEGKRASETLFMDYHRKHKVLIKIIRIFNTFGPRMSIDDGRVVSNFIVQALRNEDITIYGTGEQTRCFCFVEDLIEAMVRFMDTENAFTGPLNVGNVEEISMKGLASKIIDLTGSHSKVVYKALPEDDPVRRKPDISLAKERLSWEPGVSIDEGLMRTIEYFKEILRG